MRYKKGQIVYINTGGDTSTGVIDDQVYSHQGERGELVFTTAPKGYHWEEQDSYRIRFENGTTQYLPSDCISDNVLDFMECPKCGSGKVSYNCNQCGANY